MITTMNVLYFSMPRIALKKRKNVEYHGYRTHQKLKTMILAKYHSIHDWKSRQKGKKSLLNDVVNASRSANKQQPRQAAILQSFIPISKETTIHPLTVPKVINSLAKSRSKSVSKETKVIKLKDKLTKYQVSPTYNPQIPRLDKSKINTSKIPPMANVSFLPSQSKPKRSRTVPISGYQHASPPKVRSISPLQMKPQYIMPYGAVPVAGGHINGHYLYPQPQMVYTTTVPPQAMHPRPQLHPQLGLAQNAAIYSPQQFYRRWFCPMYQYHD